MELEALQESLQEIKATGATLVAVSPMREPHLRKMAEKNHLEFDLLRDEGNVVSAKFGLVFRLPDDLIELYKTFGADLVRFNGDHSWTLPMPARFVIDQKGILRHADVNADYTVRPDPSETIAVLKKLASVGEGFTSSYALLPGSL
jgi:peroxiredoxin